MRLNLKYLIGVASLFFGSALIFSAYQIGRPKADEVTIAVLVGLGVLFFELFMIYLLIEYLLYIRDKRRWKYAYTAVNRSVAMVFVDLMRLVYLSTVKSNSKEGRRFEEFVGWAQNRLLDLRSFIEGFAPILDPDSQTLARKLEAKLQWYVRELSNKDEIDRVRNENEYALEYFAAMRDIATEVFSYINSRSDSQVTDEIEFVKSSVRAKIKGKPISIKSANDRAQFMDARFSLQEKLPGRSDTKGALLVTGPMIKYDIDGVFAIRYFLIDHFLLQSVVLRGA